VREGRERERERESEREGEKTNSFSQCSRNRTKASKRVFSLETCLFRWKYTFSSMHNESFISILGLTLSFIHSLLLRAPFKLFQNALGPVGSLWRQFECLFFVLYTFFVSFSPYSSSLRFVVESCRLSPRSHNKTNEYFISMLTRSRKKTTSLRLLCLFFCLFFASFYRSFSSSFFSTHISLFLPSSI